MKRIIPVTLVISCLVLTAHPVNAQNEASEKDIAKIEGYLAKAREETDLAKQRDYVSKAASYIMSNHLPKDLNAMIAEFYLEQGDVNNAVKYYMRCEDETKEQGYIKAAHALLEQAFDDPRKTNSLINKALSYFDKGGMKKEGMVIVGDLYFEQGDEKSLKKAANYYGKAGAADRLEKIADIYISNGKPGEAAALLMEAGNPLAIAKAGDIYFQMGKYTDAYRAYSSAKHIDGMLKYINRLYDEGKTDNIQFLYQDVINLYVEKNDKEGLLALGKDLESKGLYESAVNAYTSAGEDEKAALAEAFAKLVNMDFSEAKTMFENAGRSDLAGAVSANMKYLNELAAAADYFNQIKMYEPYVTYVYDSVKKAEVPVPEELKEYENYYSDIKDKIAEKCYSISTNIKAITNEEIRTAMMNKFRMYKPVRNILDPQFNVRKQRSQVTVDDVKI